MTFAPHLPILATGHYDGVIRIWDVSTGLVMNTFDTRSNSGIESVAFSPDGQLLASGESYGANWVRLWAVDSGELLRTLEGHESGVIDLHFSPDGVILASGSYDGLVRLWGLRP
jgi:WD40 repeat protein